MLAAQGKKPEARTAYKGALDKGEVHEGRGGAGRELLRQKLENLGEAA